MGGRGMRKVKVEDLFVGLWFAGGGSGDVEMLR